MVRPKYTYSVDDLSTGSSLGNRVAFARLDEQTQLHGLWSSTDNEYYLGRWEVQIFVNGQTLIPVETTFQPEAQATRLIHPEGEAERLFFLPFILEPTQEDEEKLRAAIFLVRLSNTGPRPCEFRVRHVLTLPPVPSNKFTMNPPAEQGRRRFTCWQTAERIEISSVEYPHQARVLSGFTPPLAMHSDEGLLVAEYHSMLQPGEVVETPYAFVFSPESKQAVLRTLEHCRDALALLRQSQQEYDELLHRTYIFTPHDFINRALQWAKVNTARVQHRYRIGPAFTNDPPQDIVVVRDVAWYALGADYITPTFVREMFDVVNRYAFHPDGKLTEYIHANELSPALHDYHLNINDDTPLYVYALYHHALTVGGIQFLRHAYPLMHRAGEYILGQIRYGLVHCTAEGTGVWGMCSWRNIIDGYTLNGAVTEINAECFSALRLLALSAAALNMHEEAARYERTALALKDAINTKLASDRTGMYVLNVDTRGVRHHDITGDLIFPVLFDVADWAKRERILTTLLSDKFWTPYGTRTVSPDEPYYDPDFGYQLVGGVWPNLTVWIAYCLREKTPEKLVEGMINAYRMSEVARPKEFVNVVPGQFPERLHGTTFVSRGMTMSPWMPPTYLWLGIEGLLGARSTVDDLKVCPALPSSWTWIAVKDLLIRGERVSAFLYNGVLYSTRRVQSSHPVTVGSPVPCTTSTDGLFACGIVSEDKLMLFIAADKDVQGFVTAETSQGCAIKEVSLKAGEAQLLQIPVASLRLPTGTKHVGI